MDNGSLNQLLEDGRKRQFWLKPVGDPERPPSAQTPFSNKNVVIDFARPPHAVEIGDILIVSVVGLSKVVYVAECTSTPREATEADIQREAWRQRWCWSVDGTNLTPNYGGVWSRYNLKPFALVSEYNELSPDDQQSIGTLKFGNDKARVSRELAEFVVRKIMQL